MNAIVTEQNLTKAALNMMIAGVKAGLTKDQAQQMLTDALKNGDFEAMIIEALKKL